VSVRLPNGSIVTPAVQAAVDGSRFVEQPAATVGRYVIRATCTGPVAAAAEVACVVRASEVV
jgi:hypothetical protein